MAGSHHPNVERYRNWVEMFWSGINHADEVDYALMVMWGESGGNPQALGRPTDQGDRAHGLFQHMGQYWQNRLRQAQNFWGRRGIEIGNDPNDPFTNIAVAAWLRAVGGWGHWEVAQTWYPEGSWGNNTFWDGWQYQNMARQGTPNPPRGDGQIAGDEQAGGPGWGYFSNPVPGAPQPGEDGLWGAPRTGHTHAGWDLNAPGWVGGTGHGGSTPVRAAAAGVVEWADYSEQGGGFVLWIRHPNGWLTKYMHLGSYTNYTEKRHEREGDLAFAPFAVRQGDTVEVGQVIGYMGDTGNPAPQAFHLHFEIHQPGVGPVDPATTGFFDRTAVGQLRDDLGLDPMNVPSTEREYLGSMVDRAIDVMSRAMAGGARIPIWQQENLNLDPLGREPLSPDEGDEGEQEDKPDLTRVSEILRRVEGEGLPSDMEAL